MSRPTTDRATETWNHIERLLTDECGLPPDQGIEYQRPNCINAIRNEIGVPPWRGYVPSKHMGPAMSENIRRAERKEEEARNLLREAAYLRDLEKRLEAAKKHQSPDPGHHK